MKKLRNWLMGIGVLLLLMGVKWFRWTQPNEVLRSRNGNYTLTITAEPDENYHLHPIRYLLDSMDSRATIVVTCSVFQNGKVEPISEPLRVSERDDSIPNRVRWRKDGKGVYVLGGGWHSLYCHLKPSPRWENPMGEKPFLPAA